ncbi:MAG: hypothetical protein IPO78_07540 [Saprospiraceae bacterium]|nr:hypothetical protein [Saprospiraceae bacterium]MBK8484200.1 hypothetical protein [Saprospiraceae bacterium]MBK9221602.1 hypothetical protein [Saprospiraceae bacterium]MBK9721460.1 hypothetical protein [Saprospiraceae bacterium]MBK9728525.1 hypothetical protein [Saprospiraceae bacterium]
MNENLEKSSILILISLGIILVLSRILPHVPNFTASIAVILFAATILRNGWSFGILILCYWLSDLVINNWIYPASDFMWFTNGFYWIVIPYLIVFLAAKVYNRDHFSPLRILSSSFLTSLLFFVVSNFGVWISSVVTYSKDLNGLLLCYWNAIPFFSYELAGTVFYSSIIFGIYWLFESRFQVHEQRV